MKKLILPVLLALATVSSTACAQNSLSARDVAQRLQSAGYSQIHDIEYDDNLWEAEVIRRNGTRGEVLIDAATGEIYDTHSDRRVLDAQQITVALERAGYTRIHEMEREGVLWEVEATHSDGRRMDLKVSGYDGHIIHSKRDYDWGPSSQYRHGGEPEWVESKREWVQQKRDYYRNRNHH